MRRALLPSLSLLFTSWLPGALAAGGMGDTTFTACTLSVAYVVFDDQSAQALNGSAKLHHKCENRLQIESLYLCLRVHGEGSDGWRQSLAHENQTCQTYLGISLPPLSIVDHYSEEDLAAVRRLTFQERVDSVTVREVILPSDRLWAASYNTLTGWGHVYYYHYAYGVAVVVFWIGIVTVGISSRLLWAIAQSQRYSEYAQQPLGLFDRSALWLKRHVTIPATFGYRCSQNMGWCTIPSRAQSLTLLAFILLNTFFCCHGYIFTEDNLYFPTLEKQFWRYLSDRTGIISFANFPIIWLFGMRNNVLSWATGWDFGMYNNFHRWVARVATLQAVVHSIGYTVLIFIDGGWAYYWSWWSQMFWWVGQVATVVMCGILAFSVYWMRRKHYEFFLVSHIFLSIVTLITMILHVSIFKTRYDLLGWVPAAIWALDRVFRMARTLSFNLRFWDTWASATYDPSTNMVRLSVTQAKAWYDPAPGTFYYIHVLSDARFWESHPFTMAYSTGHRRRPSKDSTEDTPLMQNEDDISLAMADPSTSASMTFLIRPYDSFTSRLRDAAAMQWPSPAPLRILVEGPYGHTQPFADFSHVLFIVGGSGIAVPLAYLHALIASARTRTIRIVWAVRELALAEDVVNEDMAALVHSKKLNIKICVTHRDTSGQEAMAAFPKKVNALHGRPNVAMEVEDAAAWAGGSSLAVVACGPARMADDARRAVVDQLGEKRPRIEYFEESFKW